METTLNNKTHAIRIVLGSCDWNLVLELKEQEFHRSSIWQLEHQEILDLALQFLFVYVFWFFPNPFRIQICPRAITSCNHPVLRGLFSWDLNGRLLSFWPWLVHFSPPLVLLVSGCDFFKCRLIRKCCTIPAVSFPRKCKSNELDNTYRFPFCSSGQASACTGLDAPVSYGDVNQTFEYVARWPFVSIPHLPVHLFIEYLLFWDRSPMPVSIQVYKRFGPLLLGSLSSQASWRSPALSIFQCVQSRMSRHHWWLGSWKSYIVEFVHAKAAFEPRLTAW